MSTSVALAIQSQELPQVESTALNLLLQWISDRVSHAHNQWLHTQIENIAKSNSNRDLHITLGLIPRKFGRTDLDLSTLDLKAADLCVKGWNPCNWSIDTAARVAVLCCMAEQNVQRFNDTITDLFQGADLAESIALYSGSALYPESDELAWLIGEGLRSNIRSVFESIAHNNPYPALHFDQNRWNHMVLKALFVETTLAPIVGLDQRANPELATILCDYAQERWAAGRPVSIELWRCVGPHAQGAMIDNLQLAARSANVAEHNAAVLALSACPDPVARAMVDNYPATAEGVIKGSITWDSLCSV